MKNLLLLRHAKSDWSDPHLDDHDRPLNRRGKIDAPRMASQVSQHDWPVERVFCSTSLRTRQTWHHFQQQSTWKEAECTFHRDLYLASTRELLSFLRNVDEEIQSIALIGHNPGLHDFTNQLIAPRTIHAFPTCAIAMISLNLSFWGEIDSMSGTLHSFLTAKDTAEE